MRCKLHYHLGYFGLLLLLFSSCRMQMFAQQHESQMALQLSYLPQFHKNGVSMQDTAQLLAQRPGIAGMVHQENKLKQLRALRLAKSATALSLHLSMAKPSCRHVQALQSGRKLSQVLKPLISRSDSVPNSGTDSLFFQRYNPLFLATGGLGVLSVGGGIAALVCTELLGLDDLAILIAAGSGIVLLIAFIMSIVSICLYFISKKQMHGIGFALIPIILFLVLALSLGLIG